MQKTLVHPRQNSGVVVFRAGLRFLLVAWLGLDGLGFRLWGLGFRLWGLGFRLWGLGFRLWGLGFRV